MQGSPEFPFFEIDAPARQHVPDLLNLHWSPQHVHMDSTAYAALQRRVTEAPSVQDLRCLIAATPSQQDWRPTLRFPKAATQRFFPHEAGQHRPHQQVFARLQAQGYPIHEKLLDGDDGGDAERNAWRAVRALFDANASPKWEAPPGGGVAASTAKVLPTVLALEAVFSSVWVEQPIGEAQHVVDQLWVLSSAKHPGERIVVAVEIDGSHKFSAAARETWYGAAVPPLHNIRARTHKLFEQGLHVYRIGSESCKHGAAAQVQLLWNRLCVAEFLKWRNEIDLGQFDDKALAFWIEKNA